MGAGKSKVGTSTVRAAGKKSSSSSGVGSSSEGVENRRREAEHVKTPKNAVKDKDDFYPAWASAEKNFPYKIIDMAQKYGAKLSTKQVVSEMKKAGINFNESNFIAMYNKQTERGKKDMLSSMMVASYINKEVKKALGFNSTYTGVISGKIPSMFKQTAENYRKLGGFNSDDLKFHFEHLKANIGSALGIYYGGSNGIILKSGAIFGKTKQDWDNKYGIRDYLLKQSHSIKTSGISTVVHEMGHHLDSLLYIKKNGKLRPQVNMPFIKISSSMPNVSEFSGGGKKSGVSKYGSSNNSEAFAESFNAFCHGQTLAQGHDFHKEFVKLMKDNGLGHLYGIIPRVMQGKVK